MAIAGYVSKTMTRGEFMKDLERRKDRGVMRLPFVYTGLDEVSFRQTEQILETRLGGIPGQAMLIER